jgi:predicted DNA-binding transcriptional regulator AlpA
MNANMFIQITHEQLAELIKEGVREGLKDFKQPKEPAEANEILTAKEALNLLSISLPTLNSYVKKGYLTKSKMEGRVYYNRTQIKDCLKRLKSE